MSTDAIGAYSKDTVYGQLTAPFLYGNENKPFNPVHINAHTPLDEPQEAKTTTLNDFRQNVVKDKLFHEEDFVNTEALGMKTDAVEQDLLKKSVNSDFPPETVSNFTASSLSKSDIVNGAIKNGYSPSQAMTVAKANVAYAKSLVNPTSNVVDALSSHVMNGNKLASTGASIIGNVSQQYNTFLNS